MRITKKEREYQEKIHHYSVSTGRCIRNLIALSKLSTTLKIDVPKLKQCLSMLDGVVKEK